jgi:hypothetical protein
MSEKNAPLFICLTLDVDPDANRACAGRLDAISPHSGGGVSVEACRRGLAFLDETVRRLDLPCTLFWEARTLELLSAADPALIRAWVANPKAEHACHALKHEDFAGTDSGIPIGERETLAIVKEATGTVARLTGSTPEGFRAPYCRMTPALSAALLDAGYRYDATLTRTAGKQWDMRPYTLVQSGGKCLKELALCRSHDDDGRPITSYLWQMFEGRRKPAQYVNLACRLKDTCRGGLFQIALHPWHIFVDERGQQLTAQARNDLTLVLEQVSKLSGIRFLTARSYLAEVA